MKRIKLLLTVFLAAAVFGACDSKSDPATASIFKVLSATTGKSAKGASPKTLDASTTYQEVGGVEITGKIINSSGALADAAFTIDYEDIIPGNSKAHYFTQTLSGTSGTYAYNAQMKLAMGGAKTGMKYGDYGYWQETITYTNNDVAQPKQFVSDAVMFFDDADKATNITLAANNTGKYTFSGNVLGSAELYDHSSGTKTYEKSGEVTGTMTLNADFKNSSFDYLMSLYINGYKWYDFEQAAGTNIDLTTGAFTAPANSMLVTGTPDSNISEYTPGSTNAITSSLEGQFLGPDNNSIPREGVGVFEASFNTPNDDDRSMNIYGAFGVKR
ncbi:hypothetical protein Dip510_000203 [Elusimicrobium posterum]|uniref:hypothetical protein n=1 Tax=Elusimicrobium posterum TaxID=3116653 RepID=UPI003C73BADF